MMRSRPLFYRLIGRLAVPCGDGPLGLIEWAQAGGVRRVALTEVGPLEVSTVFLGIDHNHGVGPSGDAILFETMIFGGDLEGGPLDYQTRCATWDEAERQHAEAVAHARELVAQATMPLPAKEQP